MSWFMDNEETMAWQAIDCYRLFRWIDDSECYHCIGVASTLAHARILLDRLPEAATTLILPPGITADDVTMAKIVRQVRDRARQVQIQEAQEQGDLDAVRLLMERGPGGDHDEAYGWGAANYLLSTRERVALLKLRARFLEQRAGNMREY
jgi:hypothetical protein